MSYRFCFNRTHDCTNKIWDSIHEFVKIWGKTNISEKPVNLAEYSELSNFPETQLPSSVEAWISMCLQLNAQSSSNILRDSLEVRRLAQHNATTILVQCEDDVFWAIQDKHLNQDDPPVTGYILNHDTSEIEYWKVLSPCISSFAISYFSSFIYPSGGSCSVDTPNDEAWKNAMREAFPINLQWPTMDIYEGEGVIALVTPSVFDDGEYRLTVAAYSPNHFTSLPKCVMDLTHNGGSFSGLWPKS